MAQEQLPFGQNDDSPDLAGVALDFGDITGFIITLKIKKPSGTVITRIAIIDNGPLSLFHFDWTGTSFSEHGIYRCKVTVENVAAKKESTARFDFVVDEDIV